MTAHRPTLRSSSWAGVSLNVGRSKIATAVTFDPSAILSLEIAAARARRPDSAELRQIPPVDHTDSRSATRRSGVRLQRVP